MVQPVKAQVACGAYTLGPVVCPARGSYPEGIRYVVPASAAPVDLTITLADGATVATRGIDRDGISGTNLSSGAINIDVGNGAMIRTEGAGSTGVAATGARGDLTIHVVDVKTQGGVAQGIHAEGYGDIAIEAGTVATSGYHSAGIYANNNVGGSGSGGITIKAGDVSTSGGLSAGIWATAYGGSTVIDVDSVSTSGKNSTAVYGSSYLGNTTINVGQVSTTGPDGGSESGQGIGAISGGKTSVTADAVDTVGTGILAVGSEVSVSAGSVSTSGAGSKAIYAHSNFAIDNGLAATHDMTVNAGLILTSGYDADGVYTRNSADGGRTAITVDALNTSGEQADGVIAIGNGDVTIKAGSITTSGSGAIGIGAVTSSGAISIDAGAIRTIGDGSQGIYVQSGGAATISSGSVQTAGVGAHGIYVTGFDGAIDVNVDKVKTDGPNSIGVYAVNYSLAGTKVSVGSGTTSRDDSRVVTAIGLGDVSVDAGTIKSSGYNSTGVLAYSAYGDVAVSTDQVSTAGNNAYGIQGRTLGAMSQIDVKANSIETKGDRAAGIVVMAGGTASVTAGDVKTSGNLSDGIYVSFNNNNGDRDGNSPATVITAGAVDVAGNGAHGISVSGRGDLDVAVGSVSTVGGRLSEGQHTFFAEGINTNTAYGSTHISAGSVTTNGEGSTAIRATVFDGNIDIDAGQIVTNGIHSPGVLASVFYGDADIKVDSIATGGDYSNGVQLSASGYPYERPYSASVQVNSITTLGAASKGVAAQADGDLTVSVGKILTHGDNSGGIVATSYGGSVGVSVTGSLLTIGSDSIGLYAAALSGVTIDGDGDVRTEGNYSSGVLAISAGGAVKIGLNDIATQGANSAGVYATAFDPENRGLTSDINVIVNDVSTAGPQSLGIGVINTTQRGNVVVQAGAVTTAGDDSSGIMTFAMGSTSIKTAAVKTQGSDAQGIHAEGYGDIAIEAGAVATSGYHSAGIYANNNVGGSGSGGITIKAGDVSTSGGLSAGIWATAYGGSTVIDVDSVSTSGKNSTAVYGSSYLGNTTINVGQVSTTGPDGGGDSGQGILAVSGGKTTVAAGGVTAHGKGIVAVGTAVAVQAGTITTAGDDAAAVTAHSNYAIDNGKADTQNISVNVGSISTNGYNSDGIDLGNVGRNGSSTIAIGSIATAGDNSFGIYASSAFGGITVSGGTIETQGANSRGLSLKNSYGSNSVALDGVSTHGDTSTAIYAATSGIGSSITIKASDVATRGLYSDGIDALNFGKGGSVEVSVGSISTRGDISAGIFAYSNSGNINLAVDSVKTSGYLSFGVSAGSRYGDVALDAGGIQTTGDSGFGIEVSGQNAAVKAGSVTTTGDVAVGIVVGAQNDVRVDAGFVSTLGGLSRAIDASGTNVTVVAGDVATAGTGSTGIYALGYGPSGSVDVTINGSVSIGGVYADGVVALAGGSVAVHNNGIISTQKNGGRGVLAVSDGEVSVDGRGTISTQGRGAHGVYAVSYGGEISISSGQITTAGERATGITTQVSEYGGAVEAKSIAISAAGVITAGMNADGIVALNESSGGSIDVAAGPIRTSGDGASGIVGIARTGAVTVRAGDVSTTGATIVASGHDPESTQSRRPNAIYAIGKSVDVTATGNVSTVGNGANAIEVVALNGAASVNANNVATAGSHASAIYARGVGGVTVSTSGGVSSQGDNSYGVLASGSGLVSIANNGSVTTAGKYGHGLYAATGNDHDGAIRIANASSVAATGDGANAIRAVSGGGGVGIESSGIISSKGTGSAGIVAVVNSGVGHDRSATVALPNSPLLNVNAASVSVLGQGSAGILARNDLGDVVVNSGRVVAQGIGAIGIGTAASSGSSNITVGSISSEGRGIVAMSHGNNTVAVTGDVTTPNDVAIEIAASDGASTLNVAKGATVMGGGKFNLANRDDDDGSGNAVVISGHSGVTINNDGLIGNVGDRFTIFAPDSSDAGGMTASAGITINNNGRIEGAVRLTARNDFIGNSGTFAATKDSDFGAGNDMFANSGTILIGRTVIGSAAEAKATAVTFAGLETLRNSGSIDLRNGIAGDSLSVSGDYVGDSGRIGVDLIGGVSDRFVIGGAATGRSVLSLNVSATDATLLGQPLALVQTGTGSASNAFTLANADVGLIHYGLAFDGSDGVFRLTAQAGAPVYRLAKVAEGAQAVWRQSADGWSSHMMEVRGGGSTGRRLWGQTFGGLVNRDQRGKVGGTPFTYDYRQDFFGAQMGVDLGGGFDDRGGATFGVTAGYVSSNQNFKTSADRFKFDTATLGAYGAVKRGPMFANLLAQYDHYWINSRNNQFGWSVGTKADGYGLVGELGATMGTGRFFAEPSVSVAWQHTNVESQVILNQSIDYRGNNSIVGKAGGRIGGSLNAGSSELIFYARAAYVHDFDGRGGLAFDSGGTSQDVRLRGAGNYGLAGLGLNIVSHGPVSGFIEGNTTFGNGDNGGGGRAGVRVRF